MRILLPAMLSFGLLASLAGLPAHAEAAPETAAPRPRLMVRPEGGLAPPHAPFPGIYDRTALLGYGANVSLLTPDAWGWSNSATQLCLLQGFPETGGPPTCPPSGGLARQGARDFAEYGSIDNVQLGMHNIGQPPVLTLAGMFEARAFRPRQRLGPAEIALLRRDMQVETAGATPWRSYITGWAPDGSQIDVAGWYRHGDRAAGQVPAGEVLYVNPADRLWNINTILTLPRGGFARQGTGYELDINNAKGPPENDMAVIGLLIGSGAWPSEPGMFDIGAAVVAQGGMHNGFVSRGGHNAFFLAMPDTLTGRYNAGFMTYQPAGTAFSAWDGKAGAKFAASAVDGSIEVGAHGLPGSPAQHPALRFFAAGGTAPPSASLAASGSGLVIATAGAPIVLAAPLVEAHPAVPASSHAPCTPGQHAWDASYEYRCVAPNHWKRAALSAW